MVVYDRTADKVQFLLEQGAVYAANLKAAEEQADVVISMVMDDGASRSPLSPVR